MTQKIFALFLVATTIFSFASCDDTETYAELLEEEKAAISSYLADYNVTSTLPDVFVDYDTTTYYQLEDGVYMMVYRVGDLDIMAEQYDLVYFRYERTSLLDGYYDEGDRNTPMVAGTKYFYYDQYDSRYSSYTTYGTGIEQPMAYLGDGAKVNLIVPSKYGFSSEISYVTPFVYTIDYYID